jgi:hypothetical protein
MMRAFLKLAMVEVFNVYHWASHSLKKISKKLGNLSVCSFAGKPFYCCCVFSVSAQFFLKELQFLSFILVCKTICRRSEELTRSTIARDPFCLAMQFCYCNSPNPCKIRHWAQSHTGTVPLGRNTHVFCASVSTLGAGRSAEAVGKLQI